jgi:ADP-ribose pyrophosphatase
MAYFFLVRGAQCTTEARPDDLEEQELLLLTRGEMEEALMASQFKVLPWAAIVALALRVGED